MCAHCCPTKAVTLDDDLFPTVDDSKCIGCGVCRQTCPFNRISPEPLIASDKR
ncbi:4Fe-4S binding protein [Ferrimonas lipolytica]